jgi:hypothetical protein
MAMMRYIVFLLAMLLTAGHEFPHEDGVPGRGQHLGGLAWFGAMWAITAVVNWLFESRLGQDVLILGLIAAVWYGSQELWRKWEDGWFTSNEMKKEYRQGALFAALLIGFIAIAGATVAAGTYFLPSVSGGRSYLTSRLIQQV